MVRKRRKQRKKRHARHHSDAVVRFSPATLQAILDEQDRDAAWLENELIRNGYSSARSGAVVHGLLDGKRNPSPLIPLICDILCVGALDLWEENPDSPMFLEEDK